MPRQHTNYPRVTYVLPDDFAQCLERFKQAAGLSSSELARLIGTTPLTVRRWGTGVRPSYRNLMALLDLADRKGLGDLLPTGRARQEPIRFGGPLPD